MSYLPGSLWSLIPYLLIWVIRFLFQTSQVCFGRGSLHQSAQFRFLGMSVGNVQIPPAQGHYQQTHPDTQTEFLSTVFLIFISSNPLNFFLWTLKWKSQSIMLSKMSRMTICLLIPSEYSSCFQDLKWSFYIMIVFLLI